MSETKKQKKPEGILQNIITYFCFKADPNSTTKLTKLCYLADVYHYQMYGKRLTNLPFKHFHFGPWTKEIQMTLEELYERGIIVEKRIRTKKGQDATIPKPNIPQAEITLSKDAFKTLEDVIIDWGEATTEEIVNYCKKTLPFLSTPFDERIDFSRTDEIKEYAKKKGVSKQKAATLDVISNKNLLKNTLKGMKEAQDGKFLDYKAVFD